MNLVYKPLLFSLKTKPGKKLFENLRKQNPQASIIDRLGLKRDEGIWVYLPWQDKFVHVVEERKFWEMRTLRNRNLITLDEQKKIKRAHIGIAGLSVGNSAALALALEGFENFRLADFDALEVSNLNRLRTGIQNLGKNKVMITAEQIYELNPYAKLQIFTEGLDGSNLKKFLAFRKKIDILIEETDNLELKINLRILARKLRIPVVSATDNGDNVILDVERYDLEPRRPIYHGIINEPEDLELLRSIDFKKKISLIKKIVGYKYVTRRMKGSINQIGKTLPTWPQLGGTAQLAGAVVTYAVRKICLKKKIKSGKYHVDLEGTLQ